MAVAFRTLELHPTLFQGEREGSWTSVCTKFFLLIGRLCTVKVTSFRLYVLRSIWHYASDPLPLSVRGAERCRVISLSSVSTMTL